MEIYTKVTNKEIEQALNGGLNKLWEVYSSLEGDKEFDSEMFKVKTGIKTKFDIRSVTEGLIQMEVAFGQVRIERKTIINITEYRDEIDERKKLMKDTLRSLYDDSFDSQVEEKMEGYEE